VSDLYIAGIQEMIAKVKNTQTENIQHAAQLIAEAVATDHLIYVFGTGQSALMTYETFYRKGVFLEILPMIDSGLSMNSGALRSGGFERLTGYAKIVLQDYDVQPGDVVIVVSNSGMNAAPVEMAIEAKKKGATVIGLTSMATTQAVHIDPGNPTGKKLFEVVDLVLDTCGSPEDSFVRLEGMRATVGPCSTVLNTVILHSIIAQAAKYLLDRGIIPAVAMRPYAEGAKEYNERVVGPIRKKLKPHLRHM
jgi:uncharacterized phosphosugar-binding protein